MTGPTISSVDSLVDPKDREFVAGLEDAELRSTVLSSLRRHRQPERLRAGDPLPAVTLLDPHDGHPVPLEALLDGRPLVLVFGSYTWPPFRRRSVDVGALYERFRERASFVLVYIAEAHPVDEWQMQPNIDEGVLLRQHTTIEERIAAALDGAARLELRMPLLVDGMDDGVSKAFAAWPERIFVARGDGVVAYAGEPGPWGFDPDAAGVALAKVLAT